MTEQERQMIEAQQPCKRIDCPHCAGTGQMTVANSPLVQGGLYLGFTEACRQGMSHSQLFGLQGIMPPN